MLNYRNNTALIIRRDLYEYNGILVAHKPVPNEWTSYDLILRFHGIGDKQGMDILLVLLFWCVCVCPHSVQCSNPFLIYSTDGYNRQQRHRRANWNFNRTNCIICSSISLIMCYHVSHIDIRIDISIKNKNKIQINANIYMPFAVLLCSTYSHILS